MNTFKNGKVFMFEGINFTIARKFVCLYWLRLLKGMRLSLPGGIYMNRSTVLRELRGSGHPVSLPLASGQ